MTRHQFVALERNLSQQITPAWAERRHAEREAALMAAPPKPKYHPLPHQYHQGLRRGEKSVAERLLDAAIAQGLQPGDVAHVSELARIARVSPGHAHVNVSHLRHEGKWPYRSPRDKQEPEPCS